MFIVLFKGSQVKGFPKIKWFYFLLMLYKSPQMWGSRGWLSPLLDAL